MEGLQKKLTMSSMITINGKFHLKSSWEKCLTSQHTHTKHQPNMHHTLRLATGYIQNRSIKTQEAMGVFTSKYTAQRDAK